jgi:Family of unknown function (DUF5678)
MTAIQDPLAIGSVPSSPRKWRPTQPPQFQYFQIPPFIEYSQPIEMVVEDSDSAMTAKFLQSKQVAIPASDSGRLRVATAQPRLESTELCWLRRNDQEIIRYRGEWLLIVGDRLVAHSSNFREVRDSIRRNNVMSPFVYYVPKQDELPFVML